MHRGDWIRIHVRPEAPHGDGARGPGAQGAGGEDDLQLPWPADQPSRGDRSPARRLRPCLPGDHRRRPRPAGLCQGAGGERRRWDRRAQRRLPHAGDRGRRRTDGGVVRRRDRARPGLAPLDAIPGGEPAENAAVVRAVLEGEQDRRATSRSSTPGRRSTSRAPPASSRRAWRRPERRSTRVPRGTCSGASWPAPKSSPGRASRRGQLGSTRRDGHDRRAGRGGADRSGRTQRRGPLEELQRRLAERPEQRPFGEALVRPGLSVIAEFKRRSPSAGEIRAGATPAESASAYEEGGAAALGAHGRTALRRLVGRPRRGQSRVRAPGSPEGHIVGRYLVYEAAAAGADAILLIVAAWKAGRARPPP